MSSEREREEDRRRIAELEKQVRGAAAAAAAAKEKRVEVPVLTDAQIARLEKMAEQLRSEFVGRLQKAMDNFTAQAVSYVTALARFDRLPNRPTDIRGPARITAPRVLHSPVEDHSRVHVPPRTVSTSRRVVAPSSNGHLPPGEKATLIAAAQYPAGITREQASVLTGYKRSSRDAYIQRLVGNGHVEVMGNQIVATEDGVAALGSDYEPLPTGQALQEYSLRRLPLGEKAVLEAAIAAYPRSADRDVISESTGYRRSSRDAYIQRLQARQLLEKGGGPVTASAVLFDA